METQKDQANADCNAIYVGRQKSACQMGVKAAYETAKANDGRTRDLKYKFALGKCQKLEKPLVKACQDGVNNFKSELAKIDTTSGSNRSPASN